MKVVQQVPACPAACSKKPSLDITKNTTANLLLLHQREPLALRSPHSIPDFLSSHLSLNARHIHVLKRSAPVSATRLAYGTLRR
ncbi:hypothetical protein J3E69DRAFT_329073, partial [Trichoderma sp. SZMC 28015]